MPTLSKGGDVTAHSTAKGLGNDAMISIRCFLDEL